jgi:hypothetical protein
VRHTRRGFIALAGGSTAFSAVPASARNPNEYSGVLYNPKTFEVIDSVRGNFSQALEECVGTLHLPNETIPVNTRANHVQQSEGSNVFDHRTSETGLYGESERRTNIKIISEEGSMTGYVQKPSGRKKIAFSMTDGSSGVTADKIEEILNEEK